MRLLAFFSLALFSLGSAPKKPQAAIIHELTQIVGPWNIVLDFVDIRDCNCDAGFEIINANKKLRTFTLDKNVKIQLLKNAGEYVDATVTDLAAARDGKNFGWPFSRDTPFEFRFDPTQKRVIEIRQIYFP